MRNRLIARLIATLAGCIDYRSARHWQASESRHWQRVDKPTKFMAETHRSPFLQWYSAACGAPLQVQTQRPGDSQRMSLLLIPLPGHSAANPAQTALSITGGPVAGRCEPAVRFMLNGHPVANAGLRACRDEPHCCYADIPMQRRRMQSIEVHLGDAEAWMHPAAIGAAQQGHFSACAQPNSADRSPAIISAIRPADSPTSNHPRKEFPLQCDGQPEATASRVRLRCMTIFALVDTRLFGDRR